jgi:hypothetical protein
MGQKADGCNLPKSIFVAHSFCGSFRFRWGLSRILEIQALANPIGNAENLMRMARLELARQSHTPLKRARIPIPPHPHSEL